MSWGVTVYRHSRVDAQETKTLSIEGFDLAEYGYVTAYQYALVNNETLFVLGEVQSEDIVLSAISLKDSKKRVIAQYDLGLTFFLMKAPWMVFFLNNLQPSLPFVMIEYRSGNVITGEEETTTYLEVYRVDPDQATLLQREQLTELWIGYRPDDRKGKYRYAGHPQEPAQTDLIRYFLTDVNNDGYADILIWKRRYVSRTNEDTRKGDFYLEKEELHVMYFEFEGMTFSPMVPLDNVRVKYLDDIIW